MWALCGKYVNSGSLFTRTHGIGSFFAWYSAIFLTSGLSAPAILWQPMQRATDGRPAYSERRASLWQYWQSILYVCTCRLCGKLIGWIEGFAAAGCRLQDETARKTRMARSTSPSAPTPALAPIGSRSPSGGLSDACEAYHPPHTGSTFSRVQRGSDARASAAARAASSTSASVWASETNAASNCEGARKTPRSHIAWK